MMINDPIADLITRIRNGQRAGLAFILVPRSKLKLAILKILERDGYIKSFVVMPVPGRSPDVEDIKVELKYDAARNGVIREIVRASKPGFRRYVNVENIPAVKNGLGTAILSTPKGILSDKDARKLNVGGEYLFYVF